MDHTLTSSDCPSYLQYRVMQSNTPMGDYEYINAAIDPITLVIKECMTISFAMRKMTRWSQSGVAAILGAGDIFGEDDAINGLASNLQNINRPITDNPLLSSFLQLRSILTEAKDLYEIDSLTLTQPFLLVIKSPSTSGHITSIALQAISKFVHYEIISYRSKNLQSTLIQIISSLTHCRFEASDQNSDDAVSLKVIRLLEHIVVSPLSNLLPDAVISEVVQTCLSLACNKKRSEVLRKAAEMAMSSITLRIFGQLKNIAPEANSDLQTNFQDTKLREDIIGSTEAKESTNVETLGEEETREIIQESENGTIERDERDERIFDKSEEPFGILCINEFLGILISMISPSNQYQQMESTRVFALVLINTAIEISGVEIPKHPSLMNLISDSVSKHVLQIITATDSPALLQASLQLFSTIAVVLGKHLKSQIELTFTLMLKSIIPDSPKKQNDTINETTINRRSPSSKEMLIECLSLLWTRSPIFFTHLFIDYDCDFDRSDLATKLIEFLCILSLPESALITTDNVPPICLEGILSFINGVNDRIKAVDQNISDETVSNLIQDKKQKTSFIKCTEILNENPKEGVIALVENGFISNKNDLDNLADFFFTKSGRLNKKVLGEFLAKPSNTELLSKFINLFEFNDLRVDEALRMLLKGFRLPGESQQIERIVELFAERYVACQSTSEALSEEEIVRPDRDSVFVLSYSIILLNTDLHNPQVKKQMHLDDYRRNLRGVYNGKDFPEWYLSKIYYSIKDREIIMPEEHHGTDKWFDDVWHNLISSQSYQHDHIDFSLNQICQFDKFVFESTVDRIMETLINVFKEASDDHIITRLMASIDKCANICIYNNLFQSIDKLINLLTELTSLTGNEYRIVSDEVREVIPVTQIKVENKDEVVTVSEMAVWFGRDFKAQLSTVVLFRLIKKTDCKVTPSWNKVIRIILTLFENCLIDSNLFNEFQKKIRLSPLPKVKPRYIISRAKLNNSGLFSTFSSFLKGYSDEPPEPTAQEIESTLSTIDCVKSVNFVSFFEGMSKSKDLKQFLELMLQAIPKPESENKRFYETEILFICEIVVCFCLLLNDEQFIQEVFNSLNFMDISKKAQLRIYTYKLLLSRKCNADIIATIDELANFDKDLLAKSGSQILEPLFSLVDLNSWCFKQLLNHESFWQILRLLSSVPTHALEIINVCESIIVHSQSEINSTNYILLLGLLDEISSLGAIGSQLEREVSESDDSYVNEIIEISKKSISLTARLGKIGNNSEFKGSGFPPSAIQALAHQCFNPCREVRYFALNSLQSIVFSIEENDELTPFGIFEYGLFPLLAELAKPEVIQTDSEGFVSTQVETLSMVSKTFLKYCNQFSAKENEEVWIGILENFIIFHELASKFDNKFNESGPELLKNMILVLQNNNILVKDTELWENSWKTIGTIYPNLRIELNSPEDIAELAEDVKAEVVIKNDKDDSQI